MTAIFIKGVHQAVGGIRLSLHNLSLNFQVEEIPKLQKKNRYE